MSHRVLIITVLPPGYPHGTHKKRNAPFPKLSLKCTELSEFPVKELSLQVSLT